MTTTLLSRRDALQYLERVASEGIYQDRLEETCTVEDIASGGLPAWVLMLPHGRCIKTRGGKMLYRRVAE